VSDGEPRPGPTPGDDATALSAERALAVLLSRSHLLGVLFGEERRIVDANGAFRDLLGLGPETPATGIDWLALTPEAYREADAAAERTARRLGWAPWFRTGFRHVDGHDVPAEAAVIALSRQPFRWVALVRDLTAQERVESQRQRLLDEASLARDRAEQLLGLVRALAAATTVEEVAAAVAERAAGAAGAAFAHLGVVDAAPGILRVVHDLRLPDGVGDRWRDTPLDHHTPMTDAVRSGVPVVLRDPDETAARYPDTAADVRAANVRSTAALPLLAADGRALGVVRFDWRVDDLDGVDLGPLRATAHGIATSLERATSYEIEAETARALHEAFLPEHLPEVPGARVVTRYRAFWARLGGDFTDVHRRGDGGAFVVGDVVGHGLASARTMARVRDFVDVATTLHDGPADALALVDRVLHQEDTEDLATAVLAVWSAPTGRLRLSSAGHLPPVLVDADGARLLDPTPGPMLGAVGTGDVEELELSITGPAVLVLFTDGLVERREEPIDEGLERARACVAALVPDPAEVDVGEVADALVDDMEDAGRADDVAVMVIRLEPAPSA
jgi:PAS domain S-box-containing protein